MLTRAEFEAFVAKKTREAERARIGRLTTAVDTRDDRRLAGLGSAWTRAHYDGGFNLFQPPGRQTALSLVFVQSLDGNTGARDPAVLGGGPTDKHLIYEGLSRVAADAVLAGAGSVYPDAFFSVWHPELVDLRRTLGLPRHPAQIVISARGRVNFSSVLFNVPDVPSFLIAGANALTSAHAELSARPWIQCLPMTSTDGGVAAVLDRLRTTRGLGRISAIGGRTTASRLVDAGLAHDLYLTTTARAGGEPDTPWYVGPTPPSLELLTRKAAVEGDLVFEHFAIIGHVRSS